MAKAEAQIRAQRGDGVNVPVSPDADGFGEKLQAAVDAGEAGVRGHPVDVPIDPDAAGFDEKLAAAVEEARVFVAGTDGVTIPVNVGYAGAVAEAVARAEAAAQAEADAHPVQIPVDVNASALTAAVAKVDALTAATDGAAASGGRYYGVWRALGTGIPLFSGTGVAGIMKSVAAWHLLADVAVEFGAVAIPALIATSAFGVAAAGDIGDMYIHFQNILTITDAMRENMAPLTGGLSAMQDAVKPEVYQLAGEAIGVMSNKAGVFKTLATQTGTVLDQLGARAEVAISSTGMNVFLRNAAGDLRTLGNVGANVFGILGNLLKSMPGYAQPLETIVQDTTGFLEAATSSGIAQGAIKTGLAFHGAAIYVGLAATAFGKLATGGLNIAGTLLEKASIAAGKLGPAGEDASAGLARLSAQAGVAAGLPWAWIGVAAAGLGFLAYKFVTAGDAADAFNSRINTGIQAAPVNQTLHAISDGLAETQSRLTSSNLNLLKFSGAWQGVGKALAPVSPQLGVLAGAFQGAMQNIPGAGIAAAVFGLTISKTGQQAAQAAHDYDAYKNEIVSLNQQGVTFRTHLAQLAVQFGGTAQAMGILTAAGITSKQMLSTSAASWAQVMAQVQATTVAYQDMGQTGGVLGADMNALDIAASEQATAMSKVNQAWDSTIGIVSGGQDAFITFQQDMLSVNEAFQQTGGGARKVTDTFAAATAAAKKAGASMTGLNAPSLQLRATWQSAFGGASSLIDSLRMMSSISPGGFPSLTRALKDSIGELMGFGKQAPQTRTLLVQLAQEINPNITNFSQLTKWLGNTKNAGSDLNKLVGQMGGNLQDLAKDAGSLSASMASAVTAQFTAAKLAANGTNTAIGNLANAMSKSGATARSTVPQQNALYSALVKDGFGARGAQSMIEAMTGSIFKIPVSHNTKITVDNSQARGAVSQAQDWINSLHGKTININVAIATSGSVPSSIGLGVRTGATGGVIPGYAPGVDSVPAVLSPGEGVLVPEAVRGIGGADAVHALNRRFGGARVARGNKTGGFATGGVTSKATFTYPNDQFIINIGLPPGSPYGASGPVTGRLSSSLTKAQERAAEKAGKRLADDFAAPWLKTATAIKDYTKQAVAEIDKYYKGPEAQRLTAAITSQSKQMQTLATKYQSLAATITAMKAYAANITSNLASSTGLSAIAAPTNAAGTAVPLTGAYIKQQLNNQLHTLQRFFNAINRLSKDKLGKTLIAQVIALGPDAGLQYANAILAGGSSLAKQLAQIEAEIGKTETKIGQEAADIQYGQSTAKGFLSGLKGQEKQLLSEMQKLGDEIAKELAKDLGVPLKDIKLGKPIKAPAPPAKPGKPDPHAPKKARHPADATVTQNFYGVQNLTSSQLRQIKTEMSLALAHA